MRKQKGYLQKPLPGVHNSKGFLPGSSRWKNETAGREGRRGGSQFKHEYKNTQASEESSLCPVPQKFGTQALPQHPAQSCWKALLDCLPSTWPSCSAPQPSTLQSALPSEQSVRTRTAHPTREDTQPIPFPYSGSCWAGRADLSTLQTTPLPTRFMLVPSEVPRVLRSLQFNWKTKMGQTGSIRHNCGSDLLITKAEF